MAADRMRLPAGAVHQHAGTVHEISERMRQARAAVGEVSIDSQAYGQLCQFLPGALAPVFEAAAGAMGSSVEALAETAVELRAVAVTAEATDETAGRRIGAAAS
jgi:hypothetical protein